MFRVTPLIAALTVLLLPLSTLADQTAGSDGTGRSAASAVSASAVSTGQGGDCSAALGNKVPGCAPPGLAKKQRPIIGRILARERVHLVTRPGLYGLGLPPRGSRYGVVDGQLVRLDKSTWRVQSIIRRVNGILD